MALDNLPGKLVVPSRDQLRQKYLGWVLVRNPGADTRPGSAPYLDASVMADAGTSILAQAVTISKGTSRATSTGTRLDEWAKRLGTQRQGPVGASGAVGLVAGLSGATVVAGELLTYLPTGLKYTVTITSTLANGAPVPVVGQDTGPGTNLPPGAVLTWAAPRPGVLSGTATVLAQADGSGLSGGADFESDEVLRARLDYLASNPPASGNDAQYQAVMAAEPSVAVQQGYTIPDVLGPGTIGCMFTLRPAQPGANRIPNPTQMSIIAARLGGQMPSTDGILMCSIVASPITVVLKLLWAIGSSGWADGTTFPLYHASPNLVSVAVPASGAITSTAFRLASTAMTEVPQVGQSVGFFDLPNLIFRRKKILTVNTITSTAYDIVVDTTNGISDTGYTPALGQACCPWSDGLNSLITPVVSYFDTLGPGEQFSSFFDPGLRQRRSPLSPQYWPNSITNRLIGGSIAQVPAQGAQQNQPPVPTLLSSTSLQDVVLTEPTLPFPAPVGTPGISSFILTLGNLLAFPE